MLARCPGITVHLNTALGRDVTLDELKERHDAVLLTIGAWWGKGMALEHADDERVVDGVDVPAADQRRRAARRCPPGSWSSAPATSPWTPAAWPGGCPAASTSRCSTAAARTRSPPGRTSSTARSTRGSSSSTTSCRSASPPRNGQPRPPCIRTELGEPGEDGRRRPVNVPGLGARHTRPGSSSSRSASEAESEHLAERGLMDGDRVGTDWDSMRTADPAGLRGGRRRVRAVDDRERDVPRSSRRLLRQGVSRGHREPAALSNAVQDAPRPGRAGRPVGGSSRASTRTSTASASNPIAFPEIESTYDDEVGHGARPRAATAATPRRARPTTTCARARTSSSWRARSRTTPASSASCSRSGLTVANQAHFHPETPTLDDIVFLPANLSRLVIDPYRDACRIATDARARSSSARPFW